MRKLRNGGAGLVTVLVALVAFVGIASAATLVGDEADNTLVGTDGSDYILGHQGNDTLRGKAGRDLIRGGKGNDTYYVDNPGDVVTEVGGSPFHRHAGGNHDDQ